MNRVVFLVEGATDAGFLHAFLLRARVSKERFTIVPFRGKSDLLGNFHLHIRRWREPGTRFVILVDQDEDDCKRLKRNITESAREKCATQSERLMVRIACREAEAWYLGDIAALQEAYPDARPSVWRSISRRKNPDDIRLPKPSGMLANIPGFAKRDAAERMGDILGRKWSESMEDNRSASFRCFASGLMRMFGE